ncbi:Cell division protein FtsI [Commensalibacter papalotli (ex Botero et al. 2024)]|uniref:Peptidoglycan glycosyltransferase n=3 Tax=Acetobacteraceae TaxID=433 RepID=W7DZL9_9PROT|nr:peptidoglycan glycosyltransferase [Commensalibacter papalotli (ex Servin-Garciduenas et al. 2014)]CAI3936225.1 Cell division protein FtsI [Commensalibacter papalotli (ex Botero et al. 2024)]
MQYRDDQRSNPPRRKMQENNSEPKLSKREKKKQYNKMDKTRARLLIAACGFCALYGAVAFKLSLATILMPLAPQKNQIAPQVPAIPKSDPKGVMSGDFSLPQIKRASIIDRNGQILAISLPVAQVYANPLEIIEPTVVANKLKEILPSLDVNKTIERLSSRKQFIYVARDISPQQEVAINNLGIPGLYFEAGERRRYPLGRLASHIMGSVDIDDHGIAGIEKFFNERLMENRHPLRLSIDTHVQTVVQEEVEAAKNKFQAEAACGIVMDVHTGEILAMISLPDYDSNQFSKSSPNSQFNRATNGMYEPGSTFKLQNVAMALELGVVRIWDRFATAPIRVGRFTIKDLKTDHFPPYLSLPEVMAYSSNPASAHIALDVGAERQREWMQRMGFTARVPIELPEAGRPIVPAAKNWGISTVMTIAFGHGIAESPLAIVRGTAATVNGGILVKPTLLSLQDISNNDPSVQPQDPNLPPPKPQAQGERVLSEKTSSLLRKILRLDVTKGTGRNAEVPGYFVGGKTGTSEKVSKSGGYLKHVNVSAFTAVFPMNDPKYAVYVMLDSPKPTKETHGWTTAGWNAAPAVSKIIGRIGPILNLFPNTKDAATIDAQMAIPLRPPVPKGIRALGPGNDPGDPRLNRQQSNEKPKKKTTVTTSSTRQ